MKKYSFVEFFCGAGGSHLGFKKEGSYETILASDIDDEMCEVIKLNNPEISNVICDDINNLANKNLLKIINLKKGELDVMFGGVVCKGFSLAGVRSSSDERNLLYRPYIDIVNQLKPKISIIENVPGMKTMTIQDNPSGKEKKEIDFAWKQLEKLNGLKSSQTKGTASKETIKLIKQIETNREEYRNTVKKGSLNVVDDIIKRYNDIGYHVIKPEILKASDYGAATTRSRLIIIAIRNDLDYSIFNFPPTYKRKHKTVGQALKKVNYNKKNDLDNLPMNHAEKTIKRFKYIPEGKNIQTVIDTLPDDLKISKFYSRGSTMRLSRFAPAPTLVPGHSNFPVHPTLNRCITVREAATIMGFPQNYKFIGSHTKRCEQVGQAVVMEMAYAIAKSCSEFLNKVD